MVSRIWRPETTLEKLQTAHELLMDVAQVLAGDPDPKALVASKVLANHLHELRLMIPIVQAVK